MLRIRWARQQTIREVEISFDTDFDHPMESVLMGHPERVMPGCVTDFRVCAEGVGEIAHVTENHMTRYSLRLLEAIETTEISLHLLKWGEAPPAVFQVRCYA